MFKTYWALMLAVGTTFVTLKVVGAAPWPWVWVLSPFWIPLALCVVFIWAVLVLALWANS